MSGTFDHVMPIDSHFASLATHRELVFLGGDRLLDWMPDTGFYRLWRYDRAVTQGNPLAEVLVEGTWTTIRTGHRLIYLGGDRLLDWVPAGGLYRLWRYDQTVTQGDPLPELLLSGAWSTILTGHELIPLDAESVLDWEPASGHYRLWRYDRTITQGDPLPLLVAEGTWPTIRHGHRLLPIGSSRVLDWEPSTGLYRIWDYASSPPQGDPFVEIIAQGVWPDLRSDHQLHYMGGSKILDWEPAENHYNVRSLAPVNATRYVDGAHQGPERGTVYLPFRTIGAALDGTKPGDAVVVASGIYRENIRIPAGVCLISRAIGAAIIHGRANRSGGLPAVTAGDGAVLYGFVVTAGSPGVLCDGTAPLIQRNLVRSNYGHAGILCRNGSRATVENNTVLGQLGSTAIDHPIGIYASHATPTIHNNIITSNDIGYAAYNCTPHEAYNCFNNNCSNIGQGTSLGPGSFIADPCFVDEAADDYRLEPSSPCRGAGNPHRRYNTAIGSRNDVGAFDGAGGYLVSLPVQEYFLESVLGAVDTPEGLRTNGTSRFTEDPIFWFAPAQRGQSEQDARLLIEATVRQLTADQYRARFREETAGPAYRCSVVEVVFTDDSHGTPWYQGAPSPKCHTDLETHEKLARQGVPIVGGELYVGEGLSGIDSSAHWTLRHELGHVAGLDHAFHGEHVMGQGLSSDYFSPVELEAFKLLYRYPPGTRLEQFLAAGMLLRAALEPFPHLVDIKQWNGQWWPSSREYIDGHNIFIAERGEHIILSGSRLTMRFSTEYRWQFRPPDYAWPTVHFGNVAVQANLTKEYQNLETPVNDYMGRPAMYLKVQVPAEAKSGWVWVTARGLESNPLWLEIS